MIPSKRDESLRQAVVQRVTGTMAAEHIPGLALAINRDGETWLCQGFGRANLELDVPASRASVFEIASLTKPFTAIAVLALAEAGRLTLEDPLGRHLPDLPPAWSAIPIRRVLNHQSGIPSYTEAAGYWEGMGRDRTRAQTLDLVRGEPLRFEAGERYGYDNTGFYLLGLLIEEVAGQAYGEFLAEKVFRPARMEQTRANDYAAVVPGRASGYAWADDAYRNRPYYSLSNTFSAGCLLSSATDLALWDRALDGDALLPADARAAMWTPAPSRAGNERDAGFQVGLGWFLLERFDRPMVAHNGGILGFTSSFLRFPDDRLTVALLTNAGHLAEPHGLAEAVAGLVLGATPDD